MMYLNESNGSPFRSPSSHHLKTTKAMESAKWKGGESTRAKTPEQKLETGWKKYVVYINLFIYLFIYFNTNSFLIFMS